MMAAPPRSGNRFPSRIDRTVPAGVAEDSDRDDYAAPDEGPEVELDVKASRFLGRVLPIRDEDEARARVDAVRKRHHDARHHVWAWRLGPPEHARERSSDDGEPSGTAGVPVLGALRREDLLDAVCVVTRWFGGVKLGSGGLVRAYGECARLAVEAAPRRRVERELQLDLECAWDDVGAVEATLQRAQDDLRRVTRDFGKTARFSLATRPSAAAALSARLIEATAGRARLRRIGETT